MFSFSFIFIFYQINTIRCSNDEAVHKHNERAVLGPTSMRVELEAESMYVLSYQLINIMLNLFCNFIFLFVIIYRSTPNRMPIQSIADVIGQTCTPGVDSATLPTIADMLYKLSVFARDNPDHFLYMINEGSFTVSLKTADTNSSNKY